MKSSKSSSSQQPAEAQSRRTKKCKPSGSPTGESVDINKNLEDTIVSSSSTASSPSHSRSLITSFWLSPWTWWILCPTVVGLTIAGGVLTYLYRGIQTYRYHEWTILPVSDTRLEAACGELTLYYMGWQDPKTEKPIGHEVNAADPSNCAASPSTPTPTSRFTGLGKTVVLEQLGCKPEGGAIDQATAWNCTKPVGKLLRAEMEASSSQSRSGD